MKAAGISFLFSFCVLAQTHQHAPPPDQLWVDLAKLPPPKRIDGLGHSHIAITTKSPEAQQWFDQGLAALHCYGTTRPCAPLSRPCGSIPIAPCATGGSRKP